MKDATVGSTRIKKDILESTDFLAAKDGDESAASSVVQKIWKAQKTEILRKDLAEKDTVFVSQPSTTGLNILAAKFAEHLANLTESKSIIGDDYYHTVHTAPSKNISRDKRVFNPREFNGVNLDAMRQEVGGRQVFIVEDILNTGGSVRAFSEQLRADGFDVGGVAALMGEKRLSLDQKTTDLLNKAFKEKGINFKAEDLQVTRLEAGGLIRMTNNIRSDNAKTNFARELQGLQDRQIAANTGRDQKQAGRNIGDSGRNSSHANVDKGIQTDTHLPDKTAEQNYQQAIIINGRNFIVADDSFRILNRDGSFTTQDGKIATFAKPGEALETAFKKRVEHSQELEGSALYVHRVEKGEVIFKPYLKTVDSPQTLNALWRRQMGDHNPIPENLVQYAKPVSLQPPEIHPPEKINTLSNATPGMDKTKVKVEIIKDTREKAKVDIQGANKMRERDDFSI